MSKYEEAEKYLDQYYKECFQGEHDITSLIESRILRLRGLANLKLGDNKNAEKDINRAIELIQKDISILDSDSSNPYLVDAYVAKADMLYDKLEYADALILYQVAERIYLRTYNNIIQADKLGILFEKIMNTAIKLDDKALATKYFNYYIENFGRNSDRSKSMMSKILSLD